MPTLYDGRFSSSLAECNGKRCSCLSRPYDDGIIVIHKPSQRDVLLLRLAAVAKSRVLELVSKPAGTVPILGAGWLVCG